MTNIFMLASWKGTYWKWRTWTHALIGPVAHEPTACGESALGVISESVELIGRVAHMPQVPVAHATGGSWPEGELGREVQTSDS